MLPSDSIDIFQPASSLAHMEHIVLQEHANPNCIGRNLKRLEADQLLPCLIQPYVLHQYLITDEVLQLLLKSFYIS